MVQLLNSGKWGSQFYLADLKTNTKNALEMFKFEGLEVDFL